MLILMRKREQTIRIGDEVTIKILGVKGRDVRVGIQAPDHVRVHRGELYERIRTGLAPIKPRRPHAGIPPTGTSANTSAT